MTSFVQLCVFILALVLWLISSTDYFIISFSLLFQWCNFLFLFLCFMCSEHWMCKLHSNFMSNYSSVKSLTTRGEQRADRCSRVPPVGTQCTVHTSPSLLPPLSLLLPPSFLPVFLRSAGGGIEEHAHGC